MNNKAFILNELKEIAPNLCTVDNSMLFSVPSEYFDRFASSILLILQQEVAKQKQPSFAIPGNYFDNLSGEILSKIISSSVRNSSVEDELEVIAPFLNALERTNVYTVPKGYFKNYEFSSLDDNEIISSSKVVPIKTKWFNSAIAASVITILFISSVLFRGNDAKFDYDAYNKMDVKKGINKINDTELERFLVNENLIINSDVVNSTEGDVPELEERLKLTTDEELQQYLKQVDVASAKSGI